MNKQAEQHLTKAKNYLAKGDEFYRKAKPEIEAAISAGASQREVSRFLLRSQSWVRDVVAWNGEGTLYGKDTARRQRDMARQYIAEAPLEQVEHIISELPLERRSAIGAAMGERISRVRHEVYEERRTRTPEQQREVEEAQRQITRPAAQAVGAFMGLDIIGHLEQATEHLRELNADAAVTTETAEAIEKALDAFTTEFQFAKAMLGKEA